MPNASAASWARSSGADEPELAELVDELSGSAPGSTTAATPAAFRAAAPSSAAPPTSIISIASSIPTSWAPTAGANGLTLTTTMSIGPMPWSSSSAICSGDVAAGEDAGVDRADGTS